jgi:FKBP-type peptidyl-prolyl cis-trans isomerase (trigger factor)
MKTNQPELKQLPDKTFIIKLNLTQQQIQSEYQKVLVSVQSEFETKGFRKGKVPLDIVKEQISEERIIEEVASHLISDAYSKFIKENKLQPVIQPQIKITNAPFSLDKDWQVEITSCELPPITLDQKYQDEVKKINQKPKNDATIDEIMDQLLKHTQVTLPSILVDADVSNRMSQLIDQTQQAGITVSQYLKNKNQTLEGYKKILSDQISKEWTLNLVIDQIAKDQKIEITPDETKAIIEKSPQLSDNPNLVYYLIQQQKVIDYLKNL